MAGTIGTVRGPAADTSNIEAVLSAADPKLGKVIAAVVARVGLRRITTTHASPFEALVRAIIFQQISGHAAAAIYERLERLVRGALTPRKLLALTPEQLRAAGLSKSKATYVHKVAEWFVANAKTAKNLATMTDEDIITALTSIPGIGVWSANVFLIFNLGRLDIMPASDLGIRRGVELAYGLRDLASAELVHKKAERWKPYRSIASLYLWNALKLKLSTKDLG